MTDPQPATLTWDRGSTRRWRKIRLYVLNRDNWICQLCDDGQPMDPNAHPRHPKAPQVHHLDGKKHGDDPTRCVAAHRECNLDLGEPDAENYQRVADISGQASGRLLSPRGGRDDLEIRDELLWDPEFLARYEWLAPFVEVPGDASPPLAMSPPPVDAVGSYGAAAVGWIEEQQGITLRWWQGLAITRQLEHREDGSLCHRSVVESAPRRAGKSVRVRGLALWRMQNADLFGETQLVIHTGSDVAICREIQRGVWRWAEDVAGWTVSKSNGKEAVETPGGDRWLVRAQAAVYGYDVCLGVVDEGWDVAPDTVSEGLEPGILERSSPQIHLTSTAHRRATSLMRTALSHALSTDDATTLLLLWGARPGSDLADPEVWRVASPHWSEDRRRMIAAKYEKALAGESDPEFDDPDPVRGFEAQYLNVWRLKESRTVGDPVISADEWAGLVVEVPDRAPDAVAVEDWFSGGVSVARAWCLSDRTAVVGVSAYADLDDAAEAVSSAGCERDALVGASIASDPAWAAWEVKTAPQKGTVRTAVEDLGRLLAEGAFAHDGGEVLTGQVLDLRTAPGVDGPLIRSKTPTAAVKAAVWAALAARTPVPKSRPNIRFM